MAKFAMFRFGVEYITLTAIAAPSLPSQPQRSFDGRFWPGTAHSDGASPPEHKRPSAPNAVKRVAGKSVSRSVPRKREEKSKPETYLRLHHVPVFVRNQDRSLRFYLNQLGFRLIMDYNYGERGRFVLSDATSP